LKNKRENGKVEPTKIENIIRRFYVIFLKRNYGRRSCWFFFRVTRYREWFNNCSFSLSSISSTNKSCYRDKFVCNFFLVNVWLVKIVFIVVIVFLGFRLLISKERKYQNDKNGYTLSVWKTFLIGFLGGVVSGLCGVGGAIFLVPLVYFILKVPIKICIGTSLLVIFFNSLSGTISYAVGGYINYKIGIIFALGAIIFAPIGAKISVKTPRLLLRRIFGGFLILTPLLLFFRK